MPKFERLLRAMRLEQACGEFPTSDPEDHLPSSWYRERVSEMQRMRRERGREELFVPAFVRVIDPDTGHVTFRKKRPYERSLDNDYRG